MKRKRFSSVKSPALRRFLRRPTSVIGCCVLILFFLIAALGPFVITTDPNAVDLTNTWQRPNAEHVLGTDNLGRDTFTRMVYGARTTLIVSFSAVAIGSVIGVLLGIISGYFGGMTDSLMARFIDILQAFPGLLLAILIIAVLGTSLVNTIIAISIYSIPTMARRTRSMALSVKHREYVQACRIFGASDLRILTTHIFPNCISQIIVDVTLALGTAILTSSALSFLGLGVQPPNAEWGAMMNTARDIVRQAPVHAIIPGIAICIVVLSFSLVGDGLRDALDPRLKNS